MVLLGKIGNALLLFVVLVFSVTGDYVIPEVKFEALRKGGFRVSIPDFPGTKNFRINANINEDISATTPGRIFAETDTATNGYFVLNFNNNLKPLDTIKYNVFVYYGRLGYRNDGLSWTVSENDLRESYSDLGPTCRTAVSTMDGGKSTCIGNLIIDDDFGGDSIDTSKWIVEHRIPTYSEVGAEFNSYENIASTRFVKNGILYLKPVPAAEVRGELDLKNGCTSRDPLQCYYAQKGAYLLPPIKSGRIVSRIPFRYGKIDIKAKFPAGDWIVPIMELLQSETNDGVDYAPKITIAFSRGNDRLISPTGLDDIGSRVFLAGPVLHATEPEHSSKLIKKIANNPFSNNFRVYTLEWTRGLLKYYVDSQLYGQVPIGQGFPEYNFVSEAPFNQELLLTLGISIGGLVDFPDGYNSGFVQKPWNNTEAVYVKQFYDAHPVWSKSWKGDNVALQIQYVKVTAL